MKHGADVAAFERAFADRVGARYAIAMSNGTVTMEVALRALHVGAGELIKTTPLTMAATSIAILNAGAAIQYIDVDLLTWLMKLPPEKSLHTTHGSVPVSLFGLHYPTHPYHWIDDAAQTLRPHGQGLFTSYSLQRSKILNTGEGGVLVTNDEALAMRARSIGSLGYSMRVDQPRIDPAVLKSPTYARHHQRVSLNARMNDLTAREGLRQLAQAEALMAVRQECAALYRTAFAGFENVAIPQHVPDGWTHDYWAYAVALVNPQQWETLATAISTHGGERPYAAWRLTFDEPAFKYQMAGSGTCSNARFVQPRLMVFQTNSLGSAVVNAKAVRTALHELRR